MRWSTDDFLTKSNKSTGASGNRAAFQKYDQADRKYYRGSRGGLYYYVGKRKQFVAPEAKDFVESKFTILSSADDSNAAGNKRKATQTKPRADAKKVKSVVAPELGLRGKLQITLQSASGDGKKTRSSENISVTIAASDALLVMSDELFRTHMLTDEEREQLGAAQAKFASNAVKLHWRDRRATLIGAKFAKNVATLSSTRNEPTKMQLPTSDTQFVWIGPRSAFEKIATQTFEASKHAGGVLLVPSYTGVVRVDEDAHVTGGQKLTLQ